MLYLQLGQVLVLFLLFYYFLRIHNNSYLLFLSYLFVPILRILLRYTFTIVPAVVLLLHTVIALSCG